MADKKSKAYKNIEKNGFGSADEWNSVTPEEREELSNTWNSMTDKDREKAEKRALDKGLFTPNSYNSFKDKQVEQPKVETKVTKQPEAVKPASVTTNKQPEAVKPTETVKPPRKNLSEVEKVVKEGTTDDGIENVSDKVENYSKHINRKNYENSPGWFLEEAKEMAGQGDKKKGYLIFNHIMTNLGKALIGINNAWGGTMKDNFADSYITQYKNSKLSQLVKNRMNVQDAKLSAMTDLLSKAGAEESSLVLAEQRIRNSEKRNYYERLDNRNKLVIQAALASDNKGIITDAILGKVIEKAIEEGEAFDIQQTLSILLSGMSIDTGAIDTIKAGTSTLYDGAIKKLNEAAKEWHW